MGAESEAAATLNLLRSLTSTNTREIPQSTRKITSPEVNADASNLLGKWLSHFFTGRDPIKDAPLMDPASLFTGKAGSQRDRVFKGTE